MARRRFAAAWFLSFVVTLPVWGIGLASDQALFAYGGNLIRAGGTLYVDLWDNKQPGVYWFCAAAEALFGGGWDGVRVAYSLWLATAGGIAALVLTYARPASRAWLLAPLFTVGIATVRADSEHVAQVESLVGLPLATLLLLCLLEPPRTVSNAARWLAAGALVAVVAVFKLVLAPVAAAVIAVALVWRLWRRELGAAGAIAAAAWTLGGLAAVAAAVALHFRLRGAWPQFVWTTFTYPRLAIAGTELAPAARLREALWWLSKTTGFLAPAAVIGAWQLRRGRATRAGLLAAGSLAWLAAAMAAIVAQKFSWWTYQMDLPLWPIGLLAALGAASAGSASTARAVTTFAACGLLVHGAHFAWKAAESPDWPRRSEEAEAIARAKEVAATTSHPCGTVYAIGDLAGVQWATGLRQAIPTHGVFWGAFLPSQFGRLPSELERGRPDLVYVDVHHRELFARRAPAVLAALDSWLARDYRARGEDAVGGTWWERRAIAGDCPAPWPFEIPADVPAVSTPSTGPLPTASSDPRSR